MLKGSHPSGYSKRIEKYHKRYCEQKNKRTFLVMAQSGE